MEIKIIITLAIAVLTACCYRMGGSQYYQRWWRPLGVGLGVLTTGCILFPLSFLSCVGLIASAGASAGLSTTYFGFINPIFGLSKEDKYWFNWLISGIALSLTVLPFICAIMALEGTIAPLLGFCIRLVILSISICLWSEFQGDAKKEELGRGFLIVGTMPLLLI